MRLREVKVSCPRCQSKQKFTPQRRYLSDSKKFTVFVKCKLCHKSIDLYESTAEIEDIKKVIRKVKNEINLKPSQSRLNLLANLKKKMYNLERNLNETQESISDEPR